MGDEEFPPARSHFVAFEGSSDIPAHWHPNEARREVAAKLRIEERELETGGHNSRSDPGGRHRLRSSDVPAPTRSLSGPASVSVVSMIASDVYPLWLHLVALGVILAPTVALIAFRRMIGLMNTAAALVIYGGLAACGEHGYWAMRLAIHQRVGAEPHATVHFFMAGVYAVLAGVLLGVIALTLLREGRRSGWFAVLFVLLVGGGLELVMNGPTGYLYHHVGLYGYLVAWAAALVIAFNPTFRSDNP
jgi:hypothetical protein